MIRMVQSTSAAHAKAYFSDGLSKSDYYVEDQELAGRFYGRLGKRIGLEGVATKEDFFALCENINPNTGQPLTPRTRIERTTGYDINFHCPKSMSILHALAKDDHILESFQASVLSTMREIEEDSKTRIRKNGKNEDRTTGELLWAEFTHQTARPVEGNLPDPHLHSHCYVFNATWDREEGKIKAGQFRDIKRDMPYYQARFHKRMADAMTALGYQVKATKSSFEIEGVPKELIKYFSKRTDEIGRIAKEQGITDAKELDGLGARTRAKKIKGISMADLKREWREQIRQLSREFAIDADQPVRHAKVKAAPEKSAKACVNFAIKHHFERASVMPERRLKETMFKQAIGSASLSMFALDQEFRNTAELLKITHGGQDYLTTKEVLAEEKRMVELARSGIGTMTPLYDHEPLVKLKGEEQRLAVKHVLKTKNAVSIVRGAAGTGKSTLMKEAVRLIEAMHKKVTVLAPTTQASREALRKDGFKDAETVAKFLSDQKMQEAVKDQAIWVDEAGLLGTQDAAKLLEIATQQKARLILGGDTRQHASVVRGDALRILNTVGGIRSAEVTEIHRQKEEEYLKAVQHLSKGDTAMGFDLLDQAGSIKELSADAPYEGLVDDYMAAIKKRRTALVIAPTHREGDQVTDAIRQRLRSTGKIGKREIKTIRYKNLNMTEGEKSDCERYAPGQYVQFNQNCKGIKRGSQWKVDDIRDNKIIIKNKDGEKRKLPVDRAKNFDVFMATTIKLSKGDKVMINRPAFDKNDKRLNNGTILDVTGVSAKGAILLRNKYSKTNYKLDRDFGHLSHAHVLTSYAAQGKTVDEVLIAQSSESFGATDAKQFYVSVSRGQHKVHIYTDDKETLLEQASKLGNRVSALELLDKANEEHKAHMDMKMRHAYTDADYAEKHRDSKNLNIEHRI